MKTIAENRRARFDYDIVETYEAGIELSGQEVKSAKGGRLNLASSYAIFRGNELMLTNASIPPYQPKNAPDDYEPERLLSLLMHKSEIKALSGKLKQKSVSLVPPRAYIKKGFIKI